MTSYFKQRKCNFTIVSSDVLKDKKLSLKAKGLFALIVSYISIPNFTLYKSFLMEQSSDGTNSFNTAWKELLNAGYLTMQKVNTCNGFVYVYDINDSSTSIEEDISEPRDGKPMPGKSMSGNSTSGKSSDGNPMPLIKKKELNKKNNIELNNTYQSILNEINETDQDNPYISDHDRLIEKINYDIRNNLSQFTYNEYYEYAYEQVEAAKADIFVTYTPRTKEAVNEWISLMASLYATTSEYIQIGKNKEKTINVKQKLLKLTPVSFAGILSHFSEVGCSVNNVDAYMKTMLINAPSSRGVNQSYAQSIKLD